MSTISTTRRGKLARKEDPVCSGQCSLCARAMTSLRLRRLKSVMKNFSTKRSLRCSTITFSPNNQDSREVFQQKDCLLAVLHKSKQSFFTPQKSFSFSDILRCGQNIDGARFCYWQVIPMENASEMQLDHVRSAEWQCVTCCEDNQPNGLCACDDIIDEETFNGCQEGLLSA